MSALVTHFDIYTEDTNRTRALLPGIVRLEDREGSQCGLLPIQTDPPEDHGIAGGLLNRPIAGRLVGVRDVDSIDQTIKRVQNLGSKPLRRPKTAVPKTVWYAVVEDPEGPSSLSIGTTRAEYQYQSPLVFDKAGFTMKRTMNENMTEKQSINPWGSSLDKLKEWDPEGAKLLLRLGTSPWNSGVLPRKEVELISLALHCACTNLDEAATRRHMRAALDAGATREEILFVLKCGVAVATHSCSLGAPLLLEEMKAAGTNASSGAKPETPACDEMRKLGQWNAAWDPFYELSPGWTESLFAFAVGGIYKSGIFQPRFIELISIAIDASVTHMYAPGTRRHIKGALQAGATPEEIMAVLHICVSMGVQSCAMGLPILAEELEKQ